MAIQNPLNPDRPDIDRNWEGLFFQDEMGVNG